MTGESCLIKLVKLIRIEVFCFLYFFAYGFSNVTLNQTIQDKVCLHIHNLTAEICRDLQKQPDYYIQATDIYRRNTKWNSYMTLIVSIPGIIITLFLGRWLDNYPRFFRFALAAPPLGSVIAVSIVLYQTFYFEIHYLNLLYSSIPSGLSGGLAALLCSTFTYVSWNNKPKNRAIRFALIDLCLKLGASSSAFLGAFVLSASPWFPDQFRNYIGVFIISFFVYLFCFLWVIIAFNDGDKIRIDDPAENSYSSIESPAKPEEINQNHGKGFLGAIYDLFDLSNLVQMVKTTVKKRENHKHWQLWHLLVTMCIFVLFMIGDGSITFQFAERVYHWDSVYFSFMSTLASIIPSIFAVILPAIMIKTLNLKITTIGIIGGVSNIFYYIIEGGITEPYAYFICQTISSASVLVSISARTSISDIAQPNEIGQVFTLLACVEATMPILSSFFYTAVFNYSIDFYPGLVHHIAAVFSLYPLITMLWIDLVRRRQGPSTRTV